MRGSGLVGAVVAHRLGRKAHIVVHIERASLVMGKEFVVAAGELDRIGPADAGRELAPRVVRVDRQQRVVQVKEGQFHGRQVFVGRPCSFSSMALIKGMVMARWVRRA